MSLTADQLLEATEMLGILDASAGYPEYHNLLLAATTLVRELSPGVLAEFEQVWGVTNANIVTQKRDHLAAVIARIGGKEEKNG